MRDIDWLYFLGWNHPFGFYYPPPSGPRYAHPPKGVTRHPLIPSEGRRWGVRRTGPLGVWAWSVLNVGEGTRDPRGR